MDIQQLITRAKETILRDGEHPPILYAENKDGSLSLFYCADLPETTQKKRYMMFGIGREHGIDSPGNPLVHVYFVVEAWVSVAKVGEKRKYDTPSQDPNKKEALIILHFDAKTGKSDLNRIEMLRNGSGQLMDLLPLGAVEKVQDNILPYFLAGTLSATMSDAELARELTGQQ